MTVDELCKVLPYETVIKVFDKASTRNDGNLLCETENDRELPDDIKTLIVELVVPSYSVFKQEPEMLIWTKGKQ